jgi:hypothetical protein
MTWRGASSSSSSWASSSRVISRPISSTGWCTLDSGGSVLAAPYKTADTTTGPAAVFGETRGQFAIQAAGTGVSAPGFRAGSDSYGMIYLPGGAGTSAVASTEVTAVASGRGPQAGLQMRNAAGSGPAGVALYVNGSGQVVLAGTRPAPQP